MESFDHFIQENAWGIRREVADGRLDFCFVGRDQDADLAAVRNAFENEFTAKIEDYLIGPYSTQIVYRIRGIRLTLVNDSNFDLYFCTHIRADWDVATQIAIDLERFLNEK